VKIADIKVFPFTLETTHSLSTAHYKGVKTTKEVYVKIETDEGFVGYGSTAPKFYMTGESQEGCVALIRNYFIPKIIGENPFNIVKIMSILDNIVLFNNSAKAAIDFALHDLIGKILNVPVYVLLGGNYRDIIPAFDIVDLLKPEIAAAQAKKMVDEGIKDLKVKAGTTPEEDVERLKMVREAVGPEVKIKIDANQTWSPKQAIEVIRKMEPYNIEFVEQPVRYDDLDGLREVKGKVAPLIMADESIKGEADAYKLIQKQVVDALNLKLVKVGGLYKARRIAALAEMANVVCMAGCTLQGIIPDTAAAHFYLSTPNVCCHEIKAPKMIANDPAQGLEIKDGYVVLPSGSGFGLKVDENMFK